MGLYIYDGHMGGVYTSEYPIPFDELYCEQCGDIDWQIGYAESRSEARRMLKEYDHYTDAFIREFLDENFPKRRAE